MNFSTQTVCLMLVVSVAHVVVIAVVTPPVNDGAERMLFGAKTERFFEQIFGDESVDGEKSNPATTGGSAEAANDGNVDVASAAAAAEAVPDSSAPPVSEPQDTDADEAAESSASDTAGSPVADEEGQSEELPAPQRFAARMSEYEDGSVSAGHFAGRIARPETLLSSEASSGSPEENSRATTPERSAPQEEAPDESAATTGGRKVREVRPIPRH